jgi:hypothetical protein
VLATSYFAGMVVRDILRPEHDPIRTDGHPDHTDDPGGGVLDGAPDTGWIAGLHGGDDAADDVEDWYDDPDLVTPSSRE